MAEPLPARACGRGTGWRRTLGALLVAAAAFACGGPTAPSAFPTPIPTPTPTPPPPRVALVSIDGLRPDALTAETTPGILALAERGAYTFAAQTVFPSTTLPGHASMLTGVEPLTHGITFDEYRETFQLSTATLPGLARAAGRQTVMVVGKNKLRQLALAGTLDHFVLTTRGDDDVVNEAIAAITDGFDLLVVHLPQVDQTGHVSGWLSAAYLAQLERTDAAVTRLTAALPAGTTVILTSDHGGKLKEHGTRDQVDMTVPWIVAGPPVRRLGPLTRPVRTVDTTPTALSLLGLTPPTGLAGKPVSEPFEPQ